MMSERPKTTIGRILVEMGACTDEQIKNAIQAQRHASEDHKLGALILAMGYASREQILKALRLQHDLRSTKPHLMALAQAEIAKESSSSVTHLARDVQMKSENIRRKSTGRGYRSITEEMLTQTTKIKPKKP